VSDDHGGMGMGPVEGMVAMEELGRGLVLEPLAQTMIAAGVLGGYADATTQAEWLPRIASGEALVVLAHQERGLRYRLGAEKTRATAHGDGWTLSGVKSLVPAGDVADAWLVPAETGEGVALFLVERGADGTQAEGYVTQDGSRAAEVTFQNAAAQLVTRAGQTALEHAADIGIAAICAEAVGVMDKTVSMTAEYLNTRKQFGVPIASFQALRHRVADMKMQLELARSMSYYASLKLNTPTDERRQAIARAKVQLGQSMRFVGQQAVQLHGGIGVTDEYVISHCFKKLTQLEMTWGDTLHHLGEVSARMQDTAGVFA
jgi:alkylation response protein AidB-like acyl-CoA dehydrogenase